MNNTRELPPRFTFYSSIKDQSITQTEYEFAKSVWVKFKIKNLTEYAELYCKIDTLLLAEIFQKFRKTMLIFSGLDAAHYISLPGFGWDTMLKLTKCNIGLPRSIDQIHFLENSIRGGLCFINTRYVKVQTEHEGVMYYDCNNLYGKAQMGMLPYDNFTWMTGSEIGNFNIETVDLDGDEGYILEVDLTYPNKLHYHHNDYPLAPEQRKVIFHDLSPYSKQCHSQMTGNDNYKSEKLISSVEDKKNYVVHIRNLKLYVDLGMKCAKIHRILKFRQKKFIQPFIEKCTLERKNAKSNFDKSLFKKIANSCYGKTIENVRDYLNLKVHYNEKSFLRATKCFTFKHSTIINENIVITMHHPKEIIHNKPYAVGFTILEYSKHFMYDFYFNKLLNLCGRENIELLMTDTDSFIFYIKDKKLLERLLPYMDFSNYPIDHPLYNSKFKAEVGYFKDEIHPSKKIVEFVGLRAKCYALKTEDDQQTIETKKVCKGLGRVAIEKRLKFEEYKDCLFNRKEIRHHFTGISSKKHNLFTTIKNKKALSCFDSKRYILPCGIHSFPFGSILIRENQTCNICREGEHDCLLDENEDMFFSSYFYHING